MFSEILKIKPRLDQSDLSKMEKSLSGRFGKIAKTFGKGIKNAFKGGAILGLATTLIDKVLNPLKEVQEAIDKTLKTSDDLATNAEQFNTTVGKLAKLVTLAKATGLDETSLYTLINKFQGAVAQAEADPTNPQNSAVKNYVGQKDSVDAFYSFITQLQKMDKNQQLLIQAQVFGEKQILKMADFLQQGEAGFKNLAKITGVDRVSTKAVTKNISGTARNANLAEALGSGREFQDLLKKGGVINESMIRARDKSERLALEKENKLIKSYNDLAVISDTSAQLLGVVQDGVTEFGAGLKVIISEVKDLVIIGKSMTKSKWFKGIFGGKDD